MGAVGVGPIPKNFAVTTECFATDRITRSLSSAFSKDAESREYILFPITYYISIHVSS